MKTRIKSGSISVKSLKDIVPTNGKILLVGDNHGWGATVKEGETAHNAYVRACRPKQFNLYDCHKDAYVTWDGGIRIDQNPDNLTEDQLFKYIGFRVMEEVS